MRPSRDGTGAAQGSLFKSEWQGILGAEEVCSHVLGHLHPCSSAPSFPAGIGRALLCLRY